MPSPTARTLPTSASSVSTSYCSILCRRMEVISSGLSFMRAFLVRRRGSREPRGPPRLAPHEFLSQSLQSSAHARVHLERANPQHDPADEVGVDGSRRLDRPAGRLLDLLHDRVGLVVGELPRRRQLDGEAALLARHQPLELACDLLDLAGPALLRDEREEVRELRLV